MKADLIATRQAIQDGSTTPQAVAQACLAVAQSPACKHAFMQLTPEALQHTAGQAQIGQTPLAGLAVSIKDLFDVQGQITQAGSVVLQNQPPARADCLAVARLRAAGAGLVGQRKQRFDVFPLGGVQPVYRCHVACTSAPLVHLKSGCPTGIQGVVRVAPAARAPVFCVTAFSATSSADHVASFDR